MTDSLHIILDDSAMIAAGQGNILASRLIHRAHAEPGWFLYAPACALVEADRRRPGTAEHIAALPGVTVIPLDLPAVLAVAHEDTWAEAHTRYTAQPALDRPDGAIVATADPDRWKGQPVRTLDLGPPPPDHT
ncbi:hypothetical protein [Streptomyces sp. UNOB3_S3]|uniref:hypothetical protein n=1 Tax=Streptomyces sp. UNOB3_S3 TaxID=2871682 RepID=UPI001E64FA27|nr:hypothetical protein [Streptomyces sp. UNOB3_S3]MCC3776615.1 hypothetical protein [Streptomyces sp. UNOB3_S3]